MATPAPSLDQWTSGFLLAAFMGYFLAPLLLLQARKSRCLAVGYVSALLVLFATTLVFYVGFWSGYSKLVRFPLGFVLLFNFLYGPLVYFYLRSLSGNPVNLQKKLWHLVPFAAMLLVWLPIPLLMQTGPDMPLSSPVMAYYHSYFFPVLPWLYLASFLVYGWLIERGRARFSALRAVNKWAKLVQVCYWGFVLASISYYVLVQLSFFNIAWDYGISVAMCVFIFGVATLAYLQPHVFEENRLPEIAQAILPAAMQPRYKNSALSATHAQKLAEKLHTLMQAEKLYRDVDLRLETLAQRMNLSRHHLSQVLNEQLQMSFFEYINSLRIREAQDLLLQPKRPGLQILEVAYQTGFNNKVSFNKSFKQATGLTPTEYRKQATLVNSGKNLPEPALSGNGNTRF